MAAAAGTQQWGQGPGDRDLQLWWAVARRCHRVPLIASSTAGCSAGSSGVAGLISRIYLGRKMGKLVSMGTGEARCAEVSETLLGKRWRRGCYGPHWCSSICWGRGYWAAKTPAAPCACPASPTASGQTHRGLPGGHLTPGKEPGREIMLLQKVLAPKIKPRLSFWGELVQSVPGSDTEQPGAAMPDFPLGWSGTCALPRHPCRSLEHLPWPTAAFFCLIQTPQQFSLALTLKYIIKTIWGLLVGCQEVDTTAAV